MNSKINHLIIDLARCGIQPQVIREFVEAAIGQKVCRTSLPDRTLPMVLDILERHGIASGVSTDKFYAPMDHGKGGWCNAAPIRLPASSTTGEHMVYSGIDPEVVLSAIEAEDEGNDEEFGKLLDIPACCCLHYKRFIDSASKLQNDLTLFTYRNTDYYNKLLAGTNHIPQYFGYGLLSYFPCSFHCVETHKRTESVFSRLVEIAPEFAMSFLAHQRRAFLYTEYDGIFSFQGQWLSQQEFEIAPGTVLSTSEGIMHSVISSATSIFAKAPSTFQIARHDTISLDVDSEFMAFLDFT